MIYLIVDLRNKQIIKHTECQKFDNELESLGSHLDCKFFHMSSLGEGEYSTMIYALMGSGEAPYSDFKLVEKPTRITKDNLRKQLVQELMRITGFGMYDCQRALHVCDWDLNEAENYLYERHKILNSRAYVSTRGIRD